MGSYTFGLPPNICRDVSCWQIFWGPGTHFVHLPFGERAAVEGCLLWVLSGLSSPELVSSGDSIWKLWRDSLSQDTLDCASLQSVKLGQTLEVGTTLNHPLAPLLTSTLAWRKELGKLTIIQNLQECYSVKRKWVYNFSKLLTSLDLKYMDRLVGK